MNKNERKIDSLKFFFFLLQFNLVIFCENLANNIDDAKRDFLKVFYSCLTTF